MPINQVCGARLGPNQSSEPQTHQSINNAPTTPAAHHPRHGQLKKNSTTPDLDEQEEVDELGDVAVLGVLAPLGVVPDGFKGIRIWSVPVHPSTLEGKGERSHHTTPHHNPSPPNLLTHLIFAMTHACSPGPRMAIPSNASGSWRTTASTDGRPYGGVSLSWRILRSMLTTAWCGVVLCWGSRADGETRLASAHARRRYGSCTPFPFPCYLVGLLPRLVAEGVGEGGDGRDEKEGAQRGDRVLDDELFVAWFRFIIRPLLLLFFWGGLIMGLVDWAIVRCRRWAYHELWIR